MSETPLSLDALNAADPASFVAALGAVFERAPWVAKRAAARRPFPTVTALHQAMFEVPNSGQEPGTVVQVLQPGYIIHDRLLRPALVGVAKAENADAPERVNTTA